MRRTGNLNSSSSACARSLPDIDVIRCDVAVVGAGVLGCMTARELTRLGYDVAVVEMREDACTGISRSNTAIVYAGYDMRPGSLKAQMCVRANAGFDALCEELGVGFARCGSLMCAYGPEGLESLEKKLHDGRESGVPGLRIISGAEARSLEPGLSDRVTAALLAPTTGTVNPWHLTFAAAENAAANGTVFAFNTVVEGIEALCENGYSLRCLTIDPHSGNARQVEIRARGVVNCAGMHSDKVHEMVCEPAFRINPTWGTYIVLDASDRPAFSRIVTSEPEGKTRGATIVPTLEGNLLLGPSSEQADSRETMPVTSEGLSFVENSVTDLSPGLDLSSAIRSFGAVRPNPKRVHVESGGVVADDRNISDFVVATDPAKPGFVTLGGVKTPGLTCAGELGSHVTRMLQEQIGRPTHAASGRGFDPVRRAMPTLAEVLADKTVPAEFRRIVCRCRQISEGQVLETIRRTPGATTVDGVKRRIGCGTGRCQGGYCTREIVRILAKELGISPEEVRKDLPGSAPADVDRSRLQEHPCQDGVGGANEAEEASGEAPRDQRSCDDAMVDALVDVVVVGSGPAGLSAAIAAREHGARRVVVIERLPRLGGILPQCIHTGFGTIGFGAKLTGPEYISRLIVHARAMGVELCVDCSVLSLEDDRSLQGARLVVSGPTGTSEMHARSVVLACGCRERPIGTLPVEGERPAGVICAGSLQHMVNIDHWNIGRDVVVLGSGDVGLIMARRMKLLGKNVKAVLEARDHCGGQLKNRIECLEQHGIPLQTRCTVTALKGHERLTGVVVSDVDSSGRPVAGTDRSIPCDLLVVSVGLIPETDIARACGAVGQDGLLRLGPNLQSKRHPWLFACGNIHYVHTLADDAAADGSVAGANAAGYVMRTGCSTRAPEPRKGNGPEGRLGPDQLICTECPKSCILTVRDGRVLGYSCNRGLDWAKLLLSGGTRRE